MFNGLDWKDWTNGKPAGEAWQQNSGQCICEIHRLFQQANGYTVNEWYAAHPDVKPEWMQRCGNCQNVAQGVMLPKTVTPKTMVEVTPAPSIASVQEKKTMCEPTTYTQEIYYSEPTTATTPTLNPVCAALLVGVAVVGTVGIALLSLLFFGLAILAALPISAALVYGWKYRAAIWRGALALNDALWTVITLPFVLGYRGLQAIVHHPAQTPGVLMLTGPVAITNPARLLTAQEVETIEITARPVPVAVKRPTKKAKVK